VVFGRAGGFPASVDLAQVAQGQGGFVIRGEDSHDFAGHSVAAAGDVNGDGFDDLIVGAYQADGAGNGKPLAGAAYVVFGGGFQPGPTGTAADESLRGSGAGEFLQGLDGKDTLAGLRGDDTLAGGEGREVLWGNRGADVLSGGGGADLFALGRFALGTDVDRILDFDRAEGDRIRLRGIDAVAGTPEDDAFTVIGSAAFTGTAGELRWEDLGRGVQRIEGDVDGDGAAELLIDMVDAAPVQADWFVL
jgi:Ca2+-binding RTX toxin-like protein